MGGLSWGAVPNVGGTGCCASVSGCSTLTGAGAWLKLQHKKYCCGSNGCSDKYTRCDAWKNYGLCRGRFATWMKQNCKKSCELCNVSDRIRRRDIDNAELPTLLKPASDDEKQEAEMDSDF